MGVVRALATLGATLDRCGAAAAGRRAREVFALGHVGGTVGVLSALYTGQAVGAHVFVGRFLGAIDERTVRAKAAGARTRHTDTHICGSVAGVHGAAARGRGAGVVLAALGHTPLLVDTKPIAAEPRSALVVLHTGLAQIESGLTRALDLAAVFAVGAAVDEAVRAFGVEARHTLFLCARDIEAKEAARAVVVAGAGGGAKVTIGKRRAPVVPAAALLGGRTGLTQ